MLTAHAPTFSKWIRPLLLGFSSQSLSISSPIPAARFVYFHSRRNSVHKVTNMAGAVEIAGDSSPSDHVVGKWFSVPDLRVRDHRFAVPLDYSSFDRTAPKISVFAREVVAGNLSYNILIVIFYLRSFG